MTYFSGIRAKILSIFYTVNLNIFLDKYNYSMSLIDTFSALHHEYDLMEGNLLVLFIQEIEYPLIEMEEGDCSIEQSVATEAQGEAPAPQNARGSAAPAPPMQQFPVQFAQ